MKFFLGDYLKTFEVIVYSTKLLKILNLKILRKEFRNVSEKKSKFLQNRKEICKILFRISIFQNFLI